MFRMRLLLSFVLLCAVTEAQKFLISTAPGTAPLGTTPVPATTAAIALSFGIAADAGGNVYFSMNRPNRVFKVDPNGF